MPVRPAGARRFPGLLLYPEIYQQTAPIARLSTQLASHGYVVMAPEIYHEHEPPGTVLGYDPGGTDKGNAYKRRTKLDLGQRRRAAIRAGRASGAKLAVRRLHRYHFRLRAASTRSRSPPASTRPTCTAPSARATPTPGRARRSAANGDDLGPQDPYIPADGRAAIYRRTPTPPGPTCWSRRGAFMRRRPTLRPEAARLAMAWRSPPSART